MKELPILFSAPMVRAILDGRKTMTRREIKPQPPNHATSAGDFWSSASGHSYEWRWLSGEPDDCDTWELLDDFKLKYKVGDRLWVREAWALLSALKHSDPGVHALADKGFYRADGSAHDHEITRWRPSIHMPRTASRITLEVTSIKIERLQDISEADCRAEGIESLKSGRGYYHPLYDHGHVHIEFFNKAKTAFEVLWESINGPCSWEANPWVCAIGFEPANAAQEGGA